MVNSSHSRAYVSQISRIRNNVFCFLVLSAGGIRRREVGEQAQLKHNIKYNNELNFVTELRTCSKGQEAGYVHFLWDL